MMKNSYLEVTFRSGRPIAAYYYLPRREGQRRFRTVRVEPGMVIDFGRGGKPIGIEITVPSAVTLTAINRVLRDLSQATLKRADLAPLLSA
jgi:uncharacterized protein YuzE